MPQALDFETEREIASRLFTDDPNLTISESWDTLFGTEEE